MFNRPFQFRLIKDYTSPFNNQLYLLPTIEYRNIYDGINLGLNINNRGILNKPFTFGIAPNYSLQNLYIIPILKIKTCIIFNLAFLCLAQVLQKIHL